MKAYRILTGQLTGAKSRQAPLMCQWGFSKMLAISVPDRWIEPIRTVYSAFTPAPALIPPKF